MIRLCHLSDIHLTTQHLEWRGVDWFNKRMAAWLNLRILGRGYRFRDAIPVIRALVRDLRANPPDRIVFSGDATALGFESEVALAAAELGLRDPSPMPGLAVPGNHDYCTPFAASSGLFEKYFAAWQHGERVDGETYPFAQLVGDVWLVAVNTSTANHLPWDATGAAGADQCRRLAALLHKLDDRPRILVTHYPVCNELGQIERMTHRLRDMELLVRTAAEGSVLLWIHGHRHHHYRVNEPPQAPFPVICSGSATQTGVWTYGEYLIEDQHVRATAKVYDPATEKFRNATTFELGLKTKRGTPAR